MSEIKLSEQQQQIEDGQLAKEVLDNPIFKTKIKENIELFTNEILKLEPHDSAAFPILQSARKYLLAFLSDIQNTADAGEDAKNGVRKEGGLV